MVQTIPSCYPFIKFLPLRFRFTDMPVRKSIIDQLHTWLIETADTFIIVQGPRGSGKKELIIDQALKGRPNVLLIDCKPIQEARGDGATIVSRSLCQILLHKYKKTPVLCFKDGGLPERCP